MTNRNNPKTTEVILVTVVWLILVASPVLFRQEENIEWRAIIRPLRLMIPLLVVFLINRFILIPQLLFKGKKLYYLVSVVLLIGVFTIGTYLVLANTPPAKRSMEFDQRRMRPPLQRNDRFGRELNQPPEGRRHKPMPMYANFLIFSTLLVGFDTGIRLSFRWAELEKEKAVLQKENVGSQLAFLRNQISPHFFMNTLNNIHSLIDIEKDEAKESIIRLSKLMRHLLYDSEIEKITIQKEIDFVQNYVDLMRLRYSDKVSIKLDVPSGIPDKSIPPLLFTSFLENAFKHGISYHRDSFIKIAFEYQNNYLLFQIENSNHKNEIDEGPSGIGIENARKRLNLLFGSTYSLEIEDTNLVYIIKLRIPI